MTRIAIQTDGDFQVKTDHLENPDRIFYDLAGTKPTLTHKSLTVIPVSDRFVKQIRVAEPQHNVTRVVLDLETSVEATTSRLENPDRLIIELRARGDKTTEPAKAPVKTPPALLQTPPASVETLAASVKTPPASLQTPALAEPTPAPKPAEHRQFPPPPTRPSAAPVRAQEAALDPPPVLTPKPAPAPADVTAHGGGVLATWTAPVPSTLTPAAILTPAATPLTPATPLASPIPSPRADVALPAKRNSTGERSMIRVLGLKVGRVVLDPGHGGHDTGTIGPAGLREKDLVLDVASVWAA